MIDSISALIGRYPTGTMMHRSLAYALSAAYGGDWVGCRVALVNARNFAPDPYQKTAAEQINPIISGIDALTSAGRAA